jgi:signal transduction histidine kinase
MKYVDKRFLAYNLALATAAAVVLVWISLEAHDYARTVEEDLGFASASAKADQTLGELLATTLEAETGQRGYLLTQREKFLDDLSAAREKALADVEAYRKLHEILGDKAPPVEAQLQDEVAAKFAELARTVQLARNGERDNALAVVRDESGAELMRRIRATVDDARQKLSVFRDHYRTELRVTSANLRRTTREGTFYILLLSALALVTITWHTRQLSRVRQDLREANHQLESRVKERTRQLARSNEDIQRYTHIVGHDLRAPLVNIMGFTRELETAIDVLKAYVSASLAGKSYEDLTGVKAAIDEDAPEALHFIHVSLARMDTLIAAVLKLSRQGHAALHPQRIDMRALVEDCVSQIRAQLDEADGEASIIPPLPEIVSDVVALKQIFTNLLDNAVKYFAAGRLGRITISGGASGALAYFEVRDNGRGVEPKDQQRIFDLFRRAGAQDQPGEGVGLAYVVTLVRRLGGEIKVDSDGATGSTFRFSLARDLEAANLETASLEDPAMIENGAAKNMKAQAKP